MRLLLTCAFDVVVDAVYLGLCFVKIVSPIYRFGTVSGLIYTTTGIKYSDLLHIKKYLTFQTVMKKRAVSTSIQGENKF